MNSVNQSNTSNRKINYESLPINVLLKLKASIDQNLTTLKEVDDETVIEQLSKHDKENVDETLKPDEEDDEKNDSSDGMEVHDGKSIIYIPSGCAEQQIIDISDTEQEAADENLNTFKPISGSTPLPKRFSAENQCSMRVKRFKPTMESVVENDDSSSSKTLTNDNQKGNVLTGATFSPIVSSTKSKSRGKKSLTITGNMIKTANVAKDEGSMNNNNNCECKNSCMEYVKELADLTKILKMIVGSNQPIWPLDQRNKESNGDQILDKINDNDKVVEKSDDKNKQEKISGRKDDKKVIETAEKKEKIHGNVPNKEKIKETPVEKPRREEKEEKNPAIVKPSVQSTVRKVEKGENDKKTSKEQEKEEVAPKNIYTNAYSFLCDNVYYEQKFSFRGLRPIVIDGSNMAMAHGRGRFSVRGLKICIDFFVRRGHSVYAFIPQYRLKRNKSDNQRLLNELVRKQLVFCTSSYEVAGRRYNCYDDRILLQAAGVMKAVVVSCDNYRDLVQEDKSFIMVLRNGLLMPTFVGDMLMIPQDPLGPYGPHLNDFLRFPRSR